MLYIITIHIFVTGKYDTYKGSTLRCRQPFYPLRSGKYDTYKGSTPSCHFWRILKTFVMENMILIKDRHIRNYLSVIMPNAMGNMILIKDRHHSKMEKV